MIQPHAPTLAHNAPRILRLAWPVLVGQLSVVAFSTVDTLLIARFAAADLAALSVGQAAYVTVFIGFMGVVLALGPIVAQHFGAGRLREAGHQLHQAVWVALALALVGSGLLIFPAPFLALAQATPEVEAKVRGYLLALAVSLPASLLFSVYRGFNNAVSRPKAVMAIQVSGLVCKVPLSLLMIFGAPALGLPALGVVGCGVATAIAMWAQVLAACWVLRHDKFYAPFELRGRGLRRPERAAVRAQLKLGLPMGAAILVEVTGFAFMSIFIARLGTTAVAGHQIAANMVSVLFMLPLALGSATGTLVAQRLGAQDATDARQVGWHGVQMSLLLAALVGVLVYLLREPVVALYTANPVVAAACLPLLTWLALFHTADAVQAVATFVLRAYHLATMPMLILAAALWGVGLGGGYLLAFNVLGVTPTGLLGAPGFWMASTAGLVLAAVALVSALALVLRAREHSALSPAS